MVGREKWEGLVGRGGRRRREGGRACGRDSGSGQEVWAPVRALSVGTCPEGARGLRDLRGLDTCQPQEV